MSWCSPWELRWVGGTRDADADVEADAAARRPAGRARRGRRSARPRRCRGSTSRTMPRRLRNMRPERLDHGLVLAEQLVDQHAVAAARRPASTTTLLRSGAGASSAYSARRLDDRQHAGRAARRRCAPPASERRSPSRRFSMTSTTASSGKHEARRADADQEAVDDGQRQRQPDLDRAALALDAAHRRRCRAAPRCCGARRPCRRRGRSGW